MIKKTTNTITIGEWAQLRAGLELFIDPNWSAEQALAVVELLDDLRDRIWAHYELTLKTRCREDRITRNKRTVVADPPF